MAAVDGVRRADCLACRLNVIDFLLDSRRQTANDSNDGYNTDNRTAGSATGARSRHGRNALGEYS